MRNQGRVLALFLIIALIMSATPVYAIDWIFQKKSEQYPYYVSGIEYYNENGRLYVPLRTIADKLDVKVEWEAKTQTITLIDKEIITLMRINDTLVHSNGEVYSIEAPPVIRNNRTYLPLRYAVEGLGYVATYSERGIAYGGSPEVFILPFHLIEYDELINSLDRGVFDKSEEESGWYNYTLLEGKTTYQGIFLGQHVFDLVKIYGIPRELDGKFSQDFTGSLLYWTPFTPSSGDVIIVNLEFENGLLVSYSFML